MRLPKKFNINVIISLISSFFKYIVLINFIMKIKKLKKTEKRKTNPLCC